MPINLGSAGFYQESTIDWGFETKSFGNCTYILKVDFRCAVPVKHSPTMSYYFETGT